MKNFISILLLACLMCVGVANGKTHDVSKAEVKVEAVQPAFDFDFEQAVYLPLDVYAPEGQKIDFAFDDTQTGFLTIEEKPPLKTLSANRKHNKKWVLPEARNW